MQKRTQNPEPDAQDEHRDVEEPSHSRGGPNDFLSKQENRLKVVEKNPPAPTFIQSYDTQLGVQEFDEVSSAAAETKSLRGLEELPVEQEGKGEELEHLSSEVLEEWQLKNQRTPQRTDRVEVNLSSPDILQSSFVPFDASTSPESSIPSVGSYPLSPFNPKRMVMENERTNAPDSMVSDRIHFGDNPKQINDKVGTALRSSEVAKEITPPGQGLTVKEMKQPVQKHRRQLNVQQLSVESEQSVASIKNDKCSH